MPSIFPFSRGYGDFKYFAPERYHATKEGGTGYVDDPRPCDVFSFGIALWAITSGLVPYPREDAETLAQVRFNEGWLLLLLLLPVALVCVISFSH